MSDAAVRIEQVGGTKATNPWHDHRVMLVSPRMAEVFRHYLAFAGQGPRHDAAAAFVAQWEAAPRVHADDDAIRWLCERQAVAQPP